MKKNKKDKIKCNLCSSKNKQFLFWIDKKCPVVKCKRCGFVFIDKKISRKELNEFYKKEYFDNYLQGGKSIESDIQERYNMANRFMQEAEKYKKTGRLLEIGAAKGFLLDLARKKGFEVYGVEVSKSASEYARKKLKLDVKTGVLKDAKYKSNFFDVIIMINVLEHVLDPKLTLKEIHRILKTNGVLIVNVPNLKNTYLNLDYKKSKVFCREHLSYFTPKTLTKMANQSGFDVCYIKSRLILLYTYKMLKILGINKKVNSLTFDPGIKKGRKITSIKQKIFRKVYGVVEKIDSTSWGGDIQIHLRKKK